MDSNIQNFIDKIRTPALAIEAVTGIPWHFPATQAAHESRYGQSLLAREANNLFGVTGDNYLKAAGIKDDVQMFELSGLLLKNPQLKVILMTTNEYSPYTPDKIRYWTRPGDIIAKTSRGLSGGTDCVVRRPFRHYDDWLESLQDWVDRLRTHYPDAFTAAKAGDFNQFASVLQKGGYATDPNYATYLIAMNDSLEPYT